MYSGDKNQHNIQSDLKSKARRASNILAQIDKGRTGKRTSKAHEDVRSTVSDAIDRWRERRGGGAEERVLGLTQKSCLFLLLSSVRAVQR